MQPGGNMKKTAFLLTFFVMFLMMTPLQSFPEQKSLKIGTFPIPLMVESPDSGVFIDLVKEIAKRADVKLEIVVEPPKRTIANFESGALGCFFPALDVSVPKKVEASSEIYTKKDFAFVLKSKPVPKSVFDIEGKTVGLTLGYPYVDEIAKNPKIKIDFASSDELNIKKLVYGRFDAFIVEEKSGLKALENEKVRDQVAYDKNFPLSQQKVYFAFQPGDEGKALAFKFSEVLDSMKKDGTLAAIMKKAE